MGISVQEHPRRGAAFWLCTVLAWVCVALTPLGWLLGVIAAADVLGGGLIVAIVQVAMTALFFVGPPTAAFLLFRRAYRGKPTSASPTP